MVNCRRYHQEALRGGGLLEHRVEESIHNTVYVVQWMMQRRNKDKTSRTYKNKKEYTKLLQKWMNQIKDRTPMVILMKKMMNLRTSIKPSFSVVTKAGHFTLNCD